MQGTNVLFGQIAGIRSEVWGAAQWTAAVAPYALAPWFDFRHTDLPPVEAGFEGGSSSMPTRHAFRHGRHSGWQWLHGGVSQSAGVRSMLSSITPSHDLWLGTLGKYGRTFSAAGLYAADRRSSVSTMASTPA